MVWCITRVLHPCRAALLAHARVSICVWGSGRDPVSVEALGPTHELGPCTRWRHGAMKMSFVLNVCRSGYAVVSGPLGGFHFYRRHLRYINESPDARRASVGIGRRPVVTPGPMPLPKRHSIELTHHARVASDRSSDARAR